MRYTFRAEDRDEDDRSVAILRSFEADTLDKIAYEFLQFLWNATFTYVANVTIHSEGDHDVSAL